MNVIYVVCEKNLNSKFKTESKWNLKRNYQVENKCWWNIAHYSMTKVESHLKLKKKREKFFKSSKVLKQILKTGPIFSTQYVLYKPF